MCFEKINEGMQVIDHRTNNDNKGQMMTFDIPLNDTSSAGLGITLKGKTSIVDGQSIDLGIFVKSILTGGAASRVNSLSLLNLPTYLADSLSSRIIVSVQMINFLSSMILR